jgi:hypothetical protein
MSNSRQALGRGAGRGCRPWRRATVARAAVLVAIVASALALDCCASAMAKQSTAVSPGPVVTVLPIARGRPVAPGFVGLSLEYRALLGYLGTDPRAIDPVFVRLLRNLAPGQPPVLRIGGDSTDWTWWPIAKMPRPPGITYGITPRWLAVARSLAQATDARYILGINLEAGNQVIATAEARALLAGIGRQYITALELGNEPELYSRLGWYQTARKIPVPGRPASYDYQRFAGEFSSFEKAMSPIPIAGPSTGSYWWLTHLAQFLDAEPSLGAVTVHSYWLNRCLASPSLPGYPSIPHLLSSAPPSRLARALRTYASLAHDHGVPVRIDEMNSVTCGGQRGVSDVFASALWALNALFRALSAGVDGVNIHTFPGTANQLFGLAKVGGRWLGAVRPEYYGLLMFAHAAPPGAKLLPLVQRHTGQMRTWATVGSDGYIRVVLINDSLTHSASVLVRAPSPAEPAMLERLLAPRAYATSGITIGGQSFGAQTATGTLVGSISAERVQPSPSLDGSGYAVRLPAASALMLTIAPTPPA